MEKKKPETVLAEIKAPDATTEAERDHAKLVAIRAQNQVVMAKEHVWDGAKAEAAEAKKDFDEAVNILRKLIEDSPQGELFGEVANDAGGDE